MEEAFVPRGKWFAAGVVGRRSGKRRRGRDGEIKAREPAPRFSVSISHHVSYYCYIICCQTRFHPILFDSILFYSGLFYSILLCLCWDLISCEGALSHLQCKHAPHGDAGEGLDSESEEEKKDSPKAKAPQQHFELRTCDGSVGSVASES